MNADEAYDMLDRFIRNNTDDDQYAEFCEALEAISAPPQREPLTPAQYNMTFACVDISPSLYESAVLAVEAAHGIGGKK